MNNYSFNILSFSGTETYLKNDTDINLQNHKINKHFMKI